MIAKIAALSEKKSEMETILKHMLLKNVGEF